MTRARPCALLVLLGFTGLASAAGPTTRPEMHLHVPAGWTRKTINPTQGKGTPRIVIAATGADAPLQITILPVPLGKHVLTDEQLQKMARDLGQPMLAHSVEKDITLVKVDGPASGYKFTLTPAAKEGHTTPVAATEVVVQLNGLVLAATIAHRPDAAALDAAIDVVRLATYGLPATQPSS